MSAEPVDAVRLGLRAAFCWASRPTMPRTTGSHRPSTSAAGRAATGAATIRARNTPSIPTPDTRRADCSPSSRPAAPAASVRPPAMPSVVASTIRGRDRWLVSTATSRMAATGGTRDARAAGNTADAIVTTVPTARAIASDRGWTTASAPGTNVPASTAASDTPPA
jgi:hypothetical protein